MVFENQNREGWDWKLAIDGRCSGAGSGGSGTRSGGKTTIVRMGLILLLVCAMAFIGGCSKNPESRLARAESQALANGERKQDCSTREGMRPEARLGMLSWNIHAPPFTDGVSGRLRSISMEVLCTRPDIVLLQEVFSPDDVESLINLLGFAYQRLPLEEPGNQYKAFLSLGPVVRRGGLYAFLRRDSAWNSGAVQTEFYPFEAAAPGWKIYQGDGYADKGVQVLRLQSDGDRIVILNTHLQAQYGPSSYVPVRRDQLVELRTLARSIDDEHIVIAAGDFNTHAAFECEFVDDAAQSRKKTFPGFTDPVFARLRTDWENLVEPFFCKYPNGTHVSPSPEYPGDSGTWIDFYLAQKNTRKLVVKSFELIENDGPDEPYSDHHGLLIWLEF